MNATINITELSNFDLVFEERDAKVFANREERIVVCQLLSEYVPIDNFKNIFLKISEIIKQGGYKKFIFDKRSLRAFHQPSMEWYFLH